MTEFCCGSSCASEIEVETPVEIPATETYCHAVTSICPECLRTIEGEVLGTPDGVVMRKSCPEHGTFECVVGSDLHAYRRIRQSSRSHHSPAQTAMPQAKGCPEECGLCPEHEEHTGLAIIEITSRCNLPCPVCLADARATGSDVTPAQLSFALERLIRAEGGAHPAIQFAGGEPTLHPQLIDFVRQAHALGFRKMEVDSNGVLLAQNPDLAVRLKEAGLSGIYLQMDGFDEDDQLIIRGRNLFPEKLRAIENCKKAGLPAVLSVTLVPNVNDHRIWDLIQFAATQRLTGINFQPIVLAGRYPRVLAKCTERISASHFTHEVEVQSGARLLPTDFRPTSCGLGCGLLAYTLVKRDGALIPLSRLVGEEYMRTQVADFTDWDQLLKQLSCETECNCGAQESLREKLANLLQGADYFSIGFHGMMDAYCLDVERAKRCCVHKLMMDGKLMPFCVYNMKYRPQERQRQLVNVKGCG